MQASGMMSGDLSVSWVEDLLDKSELTPAGKILSLLDEAPPCECGASCALLRYLTGQMTVLRKREIYQQRAKPLTPQADTRPWWPTTSWLQPK